jgi:hypothetical protein
MDGNWRLRVNDPLADPQSIVNSQTHSSTTKTVADENQRHNAITPQLRIEIELQRLPVQKQRLSYLPSRFVVLRSSP